MNPIPYTVIVLGNQYLLRNFAIPLAEEFGRLEDEGLFQYRKAPEIPIFENDSRPKAFGIETTYLFGALLFLPGWLAVKVLDDIYDIKIKPIVRELIQKADAIEIFSSKKAYKAFSLSRFYEDNNVLVIVAAKERNLKELETAIELLSKIHGDAKQFIEAGDYENEVHLYILQNGKVNAQPFIHSSAAAANLQICK